MKLRKLFATLIVCAMLAAILGGCAGGTATSSGQSASTSAASSSSAGTSTASGTPAAASTGQAADKSLSDIIAEHFAQIGSYEQSLPLEILLPTSADDFEIFERVLLEQAGFETDISTISTESLDEQLNLMFASNDFPEVIYSANVNSFIAGVKTWGTNGYLLPINEYALAMPNYMALWGENAVEWENIKLFYGDANGNVYQFPSQNYRKAARSWIYRMDLIEQLGFKEPTTTEELYELCMAFKQDDPNAIPIVNRNGFGYLLDGFTSAFHTNSNFWVVPESNALEYGPASDNYRDMMIYLNKMYAEGLIDREFPTTTSDQHKEYTANGRNIAEFTYSTRAQWANDLLVEGLVGGWAWTGGFISAYPDQYAEGLAIPDQAFFPIGQLWTAALQDEEKIYRLAAWLDFVSTDKGADISTFGIEGETFYYDENGWAHDMSNTNTYLTNSNVYLGPSYLTRYSYGWMVDNDKLSDLEFSEAIAGKPTYILISYEYDNAQQSRMATLSTQLQSVRDEWGVRFIMGSADPSDDAQWASYLDNLKTAGLEEALEINSATVKVSK